MNRSNIFSYNLRNSIQQDSDMFKTMRANSSRTPVPFSSSSDETRKLIQKLQKVAKDQKQKREQTQFKYDQFKKRVVERERQFHRILSKFDTHLPGDSKEEEYENYVNEIYRKILCTFQAFNQKARSLLDDRYSQLYRLMQRRIDILMQKMDKQLAKYRKVSLSERKEIQQAIKEIGAIAAETQNQNVQFRKKNQNMELRLRMLNDQKRLLLEEITNLKSYIKEGMVKNEKKERLKGMKDNRDFWKNFDSLHIQKQVDSNTKHCRTLTSRNQYRYDSTYSKTPQDNKNQINNNSNNNKFDTLKFQRQSVSQQNIISHLKQQLNRQKNKNIQVIKFSLQLEAKQEKIRELIGEEIKSIITRASQHQLPSSIIQGKQYKSSFNNHREDQQRIDNKKTQNHFFQVNQASLTLQETSKMLFEQQTRFSTLVIEINKILQLPQNSQFERKLILSTIDKTIEIRENPQLISQNNKKVNEQANTQKQNPSINLNLVSKLGPRSSNRSSTKRYESLHRYNESNLLFANYSPLDIMDITKSIQVD